MTTLMLRDLMAYKMGFLYGKNDVSVLDTIIAFEEIRT